MQCGATCLLMICKHYGAEYSSEYLSRLCFATNEPKSVIRKGSFLIFLMTAIRNIRKDPFLMTDLG